MPTDHRSVVAGKTHRLEITTAERSAIIEALHMALAMDRDQLARPRHPDEYRRLLEASVVLHEALLRRIAEDT